MVDLSKYLGIAYKDGGRDFTGVDCWGLVRLFLQEEYGVNIDSFDSTRCGELLKIRELVIQEKGKWIKVEGPGQPGDAVDIPMTKNDWHCGVVPIKGWILSISDGGFSELTKETDIRMRRRIKGYFRFHTMPRGH